MYQTRKEWLVLLGFLLTTFSPTASSWDHLKMSYRLGDRNSLTSFNSVNTCNHIAKRKDVRT